MPEARWQIDGQQIDEAIGAQIFREVGAVIDRGRGRFSAVGVGVRVSSVHAPILSRKRASDGWAQIGGNSAASSGHCPRGGQLVLRGAPWGVLAVAGPGSVRWGPAGSGLAGDLNLVAPGAVQGAVVAGIGVANHAHARVGGQHALQTTGGLRCPVGDDDHAGVE